MIHTILFDWGTYNALNTLPKAAMLGMRLTEIPPWDFSRRMRGREYFGSYSDFAGKAFTTITAHAPYYNLVSDSPEIASRIIKIIGSAVKRASMACAEVFNSHIGWRICMDQLDLDTVADVVKKLLENTLGACILALKQLVLEGRSVVLMRLKLS